MEMSRMIFVTGFARGGTTWLRNCVGTHPDIGRIGSELILFRDHGDDRAAMERIIEDKVTQQGLTQRFLVGKAPANAPHIDNACRLLPESKFLFIIRDPRDVFISHKRGTKEWMGGANSTVDGCMKKTRTYFEGYERAKAAPNLMLVLYEQLHQDFHATMKRIFDFIGVDSSPAILEECYRQNDFWNVATRHKERRDEGARKGVIGDWVNFLEPAEAEWFKSNAWWRGFMDTYGYTWDTVTYAGMLKAMARAGAVSLSEDDLHAARLNAGRLNLLLCHDLDLLSPTGSSLPSILSTASTQAALGMPALYFLLPMDDKRYERMGSEAAIIKFAREITKANPNAALGLHLNAAERFFPPASPDADDNHPDMPQAVAYLHAQIDAYEKHGIRFRTATAHGYGRQKKRPNNRDSVVFTEELRKRGILLWDTVLRPRLFEKAADVAHFADVGGAVAARGMPNAGSILDPATFQAFAPGSLIHLLSHPGNFDARKPITLGRRTNMLPTAASLQEAARQGA